MSHSMVYKILTAGDGGVGKTTLLKRYIDGKFYYDTQMTLGVDILTKTLTIEDLTIMLQLWDFGGQEQFRFMLESYSLGARGAIIMFDLTRFSTIQSIEEWINICTKDNPEMPLILIGSKADLIEEIMVSDEVALEIKEKFDFFEYLNTSSKTGENVDKAFELLTKKIIEQLT